MNLDASHLNPGLTVVRFWLCLFASWKLCASNVKWIQFVVHSFGDKNRINSMANGTFWPNSGKRLFRHHLAETPRMNITTMNHVTLLLFAPKIYFHTSTALGVIFCSIDSDQFRPLLPIKSANSSYKVFKCQMYAYESVVVGSLTAIRLLRDIIYQSLVHIIPRISAGRYHHNNNNGSCLFVP